MGEDEDRRKEQHETNTLIFANMKAISDSVGALKTEVAVSNANFKNLGENGCPVGKGYGKKIEDIHGVMRAIAWGSVIATAYFTYLQFK